MYKSQAAFAAVMIAFSASTLDAAASTGGSDVCPQSGKGGVGELQREWIMVGWEKHRGDPLFSFANKLGKFYDWDSKDVRLYDSFDTKHRVARSAKEWSAIWTEPFRSLNEARHRVVDGPDVVVGRGLASSTLEFAARLEDGEGKINGIRARTTHVWKCSQQGWKIVREHTSVRTVSREEIDSLVPHSKVK